MVGTSPELSWRLRLDVGIVTGPRQRGLGTRVRDLTHANRYCLNPDQGSVQQIEGFKTCVLHFTLQPNEGLAHYLSYQRRVGPGQNTHGIPWLLPSGLQTSSFLFLLASCFY